METLATSYWFSFHSACTVVLWGHLLGGVQWWEDPLPWGGPCLSDMEAGKWIQDGKT